MLSALSRAALVLAVALTAVLPLASSQTTPGSSPTEAAGISLRIIVVETIDEANRVHSQLLNGADFVALATKVSIDPSARSGGRLGSVSELRSELRSAIGGLQVGQVSPVVRVPNGFAILTAHRDGAPNSEGQSSAPVSLALAAIGNVKYVFDVAGYSEAMLALRQFAKPRDWNEDPQTMCRMRTQSFTGAQASLVKYLGSGSTAGPPIPPFDLVQAHFLLGQLHAYQGSMSAVVESFRNAHALTLSIVPDARLSLEEALGIAYLHRAEMENGVYHAPGDRCLLADRGQQRFEKTSDLEKAIEHFSMYLAERPDELEVRWLLNLAHMAAGTYPDAVPPAHLIPIAAFASAEDVGRFVDVAPQAGLVSVAAAGGVIVDDFDNDGRLDIVTSDFTGCQPMRLFRRTGRTGFVESAAKAGLADQLGGLNLLQADYDNDGHLDILLMRGAWELPQRKSLLRNKGNGTFTDVTVASGLATPVTRSQAGVWTDINRDGFLDLFIANEDGPAQLFLNGKDGAFEDIGLRAGVSRAAFSKGVSAGDYDNDGWPDLYVSNLGAPNFLYRNNRNGTFTEVGQAAGVPGPGQGFATWFFDYDNDGWEDIFATSYYTSVDETLRTYLKLPQNGSTLKLYRNLGTGSFQDVTRAVGLDKVFMPMGANFGDLDNDGFLDIYLGTGNPSYASLIPSVLLRNRSGTSFVDVTMSSGTGELHKGHGVAFADLDHDGDEEIVFEVGGATPGDAHALRLFENPGHGGDWITLKLTGVTSNRSAIGARIAVTVENAGRGTRVIHRTVGSGGSFGASPLQQHIGLGKSARIVSLEIVWPVRNSRQSFANVPKNQFLAISERAADYTRLERPLLPLRASDTP